MNQGNPVLVVPKSSSQETGFCLGCFAWQEAEGLHMGGKRATLFIFLSGCASSNSELGRELYDESLIAWPRTIDMAGGYNILGYGERGFPSEFWGPGWPESDCPLTAHIDASNLTSGDLPRNLQPGPGTDSQRILSKGKEKKSNSFKQYCFGWHLNSRWIIP